MLSMLPYESVETGPLPDNLMAAYKVAVTIAQVADSLATCAEIPDAALWILNPTLEQLEIHGDVFTLLTANAQELNSVRDRPVSYWNISQPNAHLIAYEVWDRLLAGAWILANSLDLVPGQCCADRFDFDVFRLSVLAGKERAAGDWFSEHPVPRATTLLAELALEVSKVARQRDSLSKLNQSQGTDTESAFRPASEFLNPAGFPKDFRELRQALNDNPWIRRDRPKSRKSGRPVWNRLKVHAGDWHELLERRKQARPDPMDLPAHVVDAAR
jgi:hypothetical protein